MFAYVAAVKEWALTQHGWMETNWYAFFSVFSHPAWHFQVSRGGVFCGTPTKLSRRTLWRGTHKTSYRIQEECTQETDIWGELGLWHFRYGRCITWWVCVHAIYTDKIVANLHMHIDNTNIHKCNFNASTHTLANTHNAELLHVQPVTNQLT